jgi:WD40 repeat protein
MWMQGGIRAAQGFLGAPPRVPDRLVDRPEPLAQVVRALRAREQLVAVTGIGGAGKTTLAALACGDRQVRRAFRDGITWLEAGAGQDPVAALATLAHRLGLSGAAAGLATVEEGREQLALALRGKRILIAVDHVSQRPVLDALAGLAPTCAVLFTTRLADLAATVRATGIPVGALTQEQSLELLGRWTGQAPELLPEAASRLSAEAGQLALGVAVAGGMVAGGRSCTDALASVQRAPARSADQAHEYQALLRIIEASIADLPEADQKRYEQLAVFAGRGPFPRDAASALWSSGMPDDQVGPLLAELTGRCLLTARGEGGYTAHDLQYGVLEDRLGADGLTAAHARLVDGYRDRYPGGWADSAADSYLARTLAGHLHEAHLDDELRAVLSDAPWIQARLTYGPPHDLIPDYGYAGDPLTRQILRTLRLSAAALAADPTLIRAQLASRLLSHPDPGITAWAAGLSRNGGAGPWLAPLTPTAAAGASALRQTFTGHTGWVRAIAITPDSTRAVTGGEDGTLRVWDLATGEEETTFTGHTDWVRAVAITPDGTRAVSSGDDRTVRVWDLATGRQHATLTGHTRPVWSVAVTPDGTRAVTSSEDASVRVWDLATGEEQAALTGHTRPVWSVAITPDGTRAVTGSGDGTVRLWGLATGEEQAALTGHAGEVFSVAVMKDGARAISSGSDGTVRVWDLAARCEHATLTGHTGWVWKVAVTRDSALAVSGGEDASVRVWDLATGQEQAALTGHTRQVFSVAVTMDGQRAVSGGDDGTVRVWDLTAGRQHTTLTGHTRPVWSVAITPDGTRAVSGSSDGTVRVWDLTAGRQHTTLTGHTRPVWSVAITSDGTRAVSSSSSELRVWDLAARREHATLTGHTRQVFSVAVTPDGAWAVSGSGDGTVRVWDLTAGREHATLTGHTRQVFSVAVTPDGAWAVSGSDDGSVRVWDLATGTEVAHWVGDYPIIACATLPGQPLKICIGQGQGPPGLLELHGRPGWPAGGRPAGGGQRGSRPGAGARRRG